MSSPLRLASSFCPKRIKSPIISKLLSPNINKQIQVTSRKTLFPCDVQQNFAKNCKWSNNTNTVKVTISERRENVLEEGFIINSPNKLDLLKYGLNKESLIYAIGKGTFGTVIKGKYHGNAVAVKIIKLDNSSDKINEYNAQHLIHENIIRIIDIIRNTNEKYVLILMEYHENSTNLQIILDNHNFTVDRKTIVKMSTGIVHGLKYCHQNGVLHLDIKPKNILLCNDQCKICDFGNSVKESEATPVYHYKGTVAYTAPEILKGEKPTTKSDIYSLGILFWQMVTRKSPYEAMDNEVVIYKVVKFNLRPTTYTDENMQDFSQLCFLCWNEEPCSRPSSSEILALLTCLP